MSALLVCGGRDFGSMNLLYQTLGDFLIAHPDVDSLIHGGAKGADVMAGFWANKIRLPVRVFEADWARDGNAAGPRRNQRMLDLGRPSYVVAFPGGVGTADMVRRAKKAGLPVLEVTKP